MTKDSDEFPAVRRCPHGDPTCPCQDGDTCHYQNYMGFPAMPCPNMPVGTRFRSHCHVEGCGWVRGSLGDCGLLRIAGDTTLAQAHDIGCGLIRAEMAWPGSTIPTPVTASSTPLEGDQ